MLDFQKDNKIFKLILEKYYNRQNSPLKEQFVVIQGEQIILTDSDNMLVILIYLLETIYYDVEPKDMLITYGETLIEYEEFGVIREMIYSRDILEKLDISPENYAI